MTSEIVFQPSFETLAFVALPFFTLENCTDIVSLYPFKNEMRGDESLSTCSLASVRLCSVSKEHYFISCLCPHPDASNS